MKTPTPSGFRDLKPQEKCLAHLNRRSQKGSATVEFGLILPMLLLILFGTLELGLALYNKSVITHASREGARWGIVLRVPSATTDEIRGRVAAVNSIFIGASNQLGEFESGAVAALWGPVVSVVSGGVGTVIVAVAWLKLFPTLARRDRMQ